MYTHTHTYVCLPHYDTEFYTAKGNNVSDKFVAQVPESFAVIEMLMSHTEPLDVKDIKG